MNAVISETIKAAKLEVDMQIPEIPSFQRFANTLTPTNLPRRKAMTSEPDNDKCIYGCVCLNSCKRKFAANITLSNKAVRPNILLNN